jgi:hypothetical protein
MRRVPQMSEWKMPPLPGFEFKEEGHIYLLNGIILPSVTTLMNPLAAAEYKTVDPEVLKAAARRGTAVHNAIENYLEFGVRDISDERAGYFNAFLAWVGKSGAEFLDSEGMIYHSFLRYAGKLDAIVRIGKKRVLVDFKTSTELSVMMGRVQLEAYAQALDSHGVKVDSKLLLHLREDGTFDDRNVFAVNDVRAWKVFSSLMDIHNYIKTA